MLRTSGDVIALLAANELSPRDFLAQAERQLKLVDVRDASAPAARAWPQP